MKTRDASILIATLAAFATAAFAHHSANMFDSQKEIVLEGTVKEFQWANPHTWIQLDVADTGGKLVEWSIEGGSPNLVARQGWKRNSFKPGDKVAITIHPMRSGEPGGSFVSAKFADGRVLGRSGAPAASAPR
jgi:uncharacterized protein DUF6152